MWCKSDPFVRFKGNTILGGPTPIVVKDCIGSGKIKGCLRKDYGFRGVTKRNGLGQPRDVRYWTQRTTQRTDNNF